MKPWFEEELAEADIIKFPVPQAKVIQMPNVQEYPDFITGVQDLQARHKEGQISQESYDKLYAELIHRFMKKESFETPWYLREQPLGADQLPSPTSNIDIGDAVQDLIDVANDSNDPAFEKRTENLLTKARDFLKNLLNKPKTEDVQPAVNQMPQGIESLFLQLCAKHPPEYCEKVKTEIIDKVTALKQQEYEKGVDVGDTQATERLNNFLKTYDQAIDGLVNKITKSEQEFIAANADANTVKMQKAVSTKKQNIDVIKRTIGGIFSGKLFKAGTLVDKQLQEKLVRFLTQAKDGIVNWGQILKRGKGGKANVDDFVPAEFKEIYEMFKNELYKVRPETTAGSWGPGEVGLILIGNPITKAGDGGDLQDIKTGDKFELKASNNPRKGGRLSPPGLGTSKMGPRFIRVKRKHFGQGYDKKFGKDSYLVRSSVNQRFIKEYNDRIDKGLKVNTKQFLTDVIKAAFTDNFPTNKELAPYVKQMVVKNKIDYDAFVRTYAKFLMVRYQGAGDDKKFKNIIVFNPKTTTYTVLDSSDDLDRDDVVITGGIEFAATQVPKSPQIGIA
jgi:hypothetical protein